MSTASVPDAVSGTRAVRHSRTVIVYVIVGLLNTSLVTFTALEAFQGIVLTVGATSEFKVPVVILLPVILRAFGQALMYAIPVALLLGAGLFIGRLGADRELVALQASGVSSLQFVFPACILGGALSILCLFFNNAWVPRFRASLTNIQELVATQLSNLGEGWNLELTPSSGQSIWIYHHDGPLLEGLFFGVSGSSSEGPVAVEAMEAVAAPSYPCFLFAERGIVRAARERGDGVEVELRGVDVFFDNDFLEKGGEVRSDYLHHLRFERLDWSFRFPRGSLRPKYLPFSELRAETRRCRAALDEALAAGPEPERAARPAGDDKKTKTDRPRAERLQRDYNIAVTEFHSRLATSFCALTFPLAALALGLVVRSTNRLLPFFVSSTVVPAVYFPLELLGHHLACDGHVPWATQQLGNIALAALVVLALRQAERAPRR
jgi:lipopolysaccharide export LptBFGC system permease protein LptF